MQKLLDFYSDTGSERVGFVLLDGTVVELENVAPEPSKGFDVKAEDLVKYEDSIQATFHTHPGSPCNLSVDDYCAFKMWPKAKHVVIGNDGYDVFEVDGSSLVRSEWRLQ